MRPDHAIAGELERLGRWTDGRFVVEPSPDDEVVPAEDYMDIDVLRDAIARAGVTGFHPDSAGEDAAPDDVNLQIAVSRFTRHYCAAITLVAAVGLARGIGIDLSPTRCRMVVFANLPFRAAIAFDERSLVGCAERPAAWDVGRTVDTMHELREYVWRTLYGRHIAPLFARVQLITRVTDRVIWTNAAEWWAMISDAAGEYLGPGEDRPFVAEREAILEAPALPGVPGPNPLAGRLVWQPTGEASFPTEIHTREACCLCYLIPDRLGRLCQNCPFLPFNDRIALTRERHGVPMGAPGGAAEKVAIERGLEKVKSSRQAALGGAR